MNHNEAFRNLERIGRDDLKNMVSNNLPFECTAYEAFRDFIRFGFYRNRKDELADIYIGYAQNALDIISSKSGGSSRRVKLLHGKGSMLSRKFKNIAAKKSKKVHPTDMKFLKSACDDLVPELQQYGYNMRHFCAKYLKERDFKALHEKLDDVKGIGSKIASLYLRDMMILYSESSDKGLLNNLTADEIKLVYPIDVWVERTSKRIMDIEGDKEEIAARLIQECESLGVSPIYVNHGIWYVGSQAGDFLLDNLDHLSELKVKKS